MFRGGATLSGLIGAIEMCIISIIRHSISSADFRFLYLPLASALHLVVKIGEAFKLELVVYVTVSRI